MLHGQSGGLKGCESIPSLPAPAEQAWVAAKVKAHLQRAQFAGTSNTNRHGGRKEKTGICSQPLPRPHPSRATPVPPAWPRSSLSYPASPPGAPADAVRGAAASSAKAGDGKRLGQLVKKI